MSLHPIDLNADVGEDPAALARGAEAALIEQVTSVNVACGGHAGDGQSMAAAIRLARRHGAAVGAHPGYPDRARFGRVVMAIEPAVLEEALRSQVARLDRLALEAGAAMSHVKPHGALYNRAAADPGLATSIARAMEPWRDRVYLVGLAGSVMIDVWRRAGFTVLAEAFADRRYEPDGRLRARDQADARLTAPEDAARQALDVARHHRIVATDGRALAVQADTLCIHGDTPGAPAIAASIRRALAAAGVPVRRPVPPGAARTVPPPGK